MMLDKKTWLWTADGLWRTADGGVTWTHVYQGSAAPYLYRAPDGTLYVPGVNDGMLQSTDAGVSWSAVPTSSLAVTKNAMYASGGLNANRYIGAKLADPAQWSLLAPTPSSAPNGGWMMAGDPDHGLVYSANFNGGLWRYAE
jgi:hypothetical protein